MSPTDRSAQITLRALVTARWVLLALLVTAAILVALDPGRISKTGWLPGHPGIERFSVLMVVWAALNLATERFILRPRRATRRIAGIHLLVDATMLTILLAMSGGPTNAFTTVYFVPITLATQVSPRWTWALAGYCLAGFAALFVLAPVPQSPPGHEMHFAGHFRGMWVAFGVSGALVTYFVHRIALSLARQRQELARLQEQSVDARHLGALGSLAAGAAHELGTPLGSIELLMGELEHMDADERAASIATVREQVARCKTILQRMASPELRVAALGEAGGVPWPLVEIGDELRADEKVRLRFDEELHHVDTRLPREVLGQVVRELVKNATEADATTVDVDIATVDGQLRIQVRDDGRGIPSEVAERAFEPFFSAREGADGLGLGLYLARAQVRQLGGTLTLTSKPGGGTVVVVTLPLSAGPLRTVP